MSASRVVWLTILITICWTSGASAIPDRLLRATPQDVIAALYMEPDTASGTEGTPGEMLIGALRRARGMGLFGKLESDTRLIFDLLNCWPVLQRYPRAYMLHDIGLRRLETGGNRLDRLAMSLVLQTGSDTAAVRGLVQQFLNSYTNEESGRLEKITIAGHSFHRLTDSSVPSWVVWEWGQVDDLFIVSIGAGSSERILRALAGDGPTLLSDDWFQTGHRHTQGTAARLELYLNVASLQERIGESAQDRFRAVVDSLDLQFSEKSIWTIGTEERAYTCYAYHRKDGADLLARISDPRTYRPEHKQLIPAEAESYAILNTHCAALVRRIRSTYLSAQRLEKRFELIRGWDTLARTQKVNFEGDVLRQLGNHVIIHDHPRHPLGLPLMRTILIEISGDSDRVRRALDRTFSYCASLLTIAAAKRKMPAVSLALRHAPDGIWYLQYGIYGPAITVADGWLIISYSPEAVRVNLATGTSPPPLIPSLKSAKPQPSEARDPAHQGKAAEDNDQAGSQDVADQARPQ